jgi:hypothetical protein
LILQATPFPDPPQSKPLPLFFKACGGSGQRIADQKADPPVVSPLL